MIKGLERYEHMIKDSKQIGERFFVELKKEYYFEDNQSSFTADSIEACLDNLGWCKERTERELKDPDFIAMYGEE